MTCDKIYGALDILQEREGSRFGTESERRLLDALGSPDGEYDIIHIAGTNGKGSTASFVSSVLTEWGKRTGTYLSPAVYSREGQYLLDGKEVSPGALKSVLIEAYEASERMGGATAFEIETAAACLLFAREGCEYAVLECGLGGLNDATNAVRGKAAALITSVGLEHTAVLGDTIEMICAQKAGIIRDCPVFVSGYQCADARGYFSGYTDMFSGDGLTRISHGKDGQIFSYKGEEYSVRMYGEGQCFNAALAVDTAHFLGVPEDVIKRGLSGARIGGRCEIVRARGKTYILDGSHNPASFGPLLELLREEFAGQRISVIYACYTDKDTDYAARVLTAEAYEIIIVRAQSYRAMDTGAIVKIFGKYTDSVSASSDTAEALERAAGDVVVVTGTFSCLGEARRWTEKEQ